MKYKKTPGGLILVPHELGGWELGSADSGIPSYVTEVLQEDGEWRGLFAPGEKQKRFGIESMACTVYNTLNICEALIKRKYKIDINFSDRWLAWASGITKRGANPHDIAETLRKAGVPEEQYWQFTKDLKSW
ncbi:MAG: hypothetical protein IIA88_06830, partial [Bacteroidetes bacterium]|nr:hypothetical protein [Bacteroidota bacterium]